MTLQEILNDAEQIRVESVEGANSSQRVGQILKDIAQYLGRVPSLDGSLTIAYTPPISPKTGDQWLVEGIVYTWIGSDWVEF